VAPLIPGWLLDRTAQVYKAVGSGGSHRHDEEAAFAWPCRVEPVDLSAQAKVTGHFVFSVWVLCGNVPEEGELANGDKLVLEDGTDLRVTSVARQTGPGGKEYLELTASRSK
jgi:hypothetical protein